MQMGVIYILKVRYSLQFQQLNYSIEYSGWKWMFKEVCAYIGYVKLVGMIWQRYKMMWNKSQDVQLRETTSVSLYHYSAGDMTTY